jgi:hypothetical protein
MTAIPLTRSEICFLLTTWGFTRYVVPQFTYSYPIDFLTPLLHNNIYKSMWITSKRDGNMSRVWVIP